MHVINARNVNDALAAGLRYLHTHGDQATSRNGDVLVSPMPVTTVYDMPKERVLFSAIRDANPFFHLMEALWMLAGRNDVAFPAQFAKHIASFSDDGIQFHAAYGHRWRTYFAHDQLQWVIDELRRDPTSRRIVLAMWDPGNEHPLGSIARYVSGDHHSINCGTKDVPCNTHIYFLLTGGALDMTVCNRSNDIIWGAYGANAVHMSVLHEFVAAAIGKPVGIYRQVSNNYHLYTNVVARDSILDMAKDVMESNLYVLTTQVRSAITPLMTIPQKEWDAELRDFINCDPLKANIFTDPFLRTVAFPMYRAWAIRKADRNASNAVLEVLAQVSSVDWRYAATSWVARRIK